MKTAHLFIDYQNLHLSAHERFGAFGDPIHRSLIHPGRFADCLAAIRNERVHEPVKIAHVNVFRGQPSNEREARPAARNKAQTAEWTRDRRVTVHARPLRYPRDWPDEPSREKGVDVLLAISLVRAAIEHPGDVIILASRDTDLLPAIEMARHVDHAIVEVAGWLGDSRLRLKGANHGPSMWCTQLGRAEFDKCRDMRDYSA